MQHANERYPEAMYIIEAHCWKCGAPQKVALIRGDFDKRDATTVGPQRFSPTEIALATSQGVIIEEHYSNVRGRSYLANSCKCGAFVGDHYLFTDYFNPAELGDLPYERIELD